ncbi:MAG: S24 family peptidase [Pseudomonadota bacterium]
MTPEAVRRAIETLIHERGEDYVSLSRMLGRNPTYIQQFIKRGVPRRLREEDRRMLARHFGVPERVLGAPALDIEHEAPDERSSKKELKNFSESFVFIPYFDIRAAAGDGYFVDQEIPDGTLAFHKSWLEAVAGGRHGELAVLRVEGDSMHPTLAHGDQIMIDIGERRGVRDGIYVIRADGALLVKRISVHPSTRRLAIKSDNPAYEAWHDCDPNQVDIIGRVIWMGRRL